MNEIKKINTPYEVATATSVTTKTGFLCKAKDDKILYLAENSSSSASATLTIYAGDGLQATTDLVMTIPASEAICFTLESGKYKKLYGEDKGKITMLGTGVNVSVFVLE